MDPLGIQSALKAAPAELQPLLDHLLDRVDALETRGVDDVKSIASQVIAGLSPMVKQATDAVNTLTIVASASVTEVTALIRRIDGARFTLKLGPEIPDDPEPSITVTA